MYIYIIYIHIYVCVCVCACVCVCVIPLNVEWDVERCDASPSQVPVARWPANMGWSGSFYARKDGSSNKAKGWPFEFFCYGGAQHVELLGDQSLNAFSFTGMSLEDDPQTFLFGFLQVRLGKKTDQTSFWHWSTDSQFVRLRYPTEFLDPDIGPSSVGNPTSGAAEILNPTRPSSNHWLWQLDQTMMRHVQKPVSNVDYIPLEVQFYMGRMDLMTGSQINKCQTLQNWLCTLFTSPIYPSIWCWPLLQVRKMNMMLDPRDVLLLGWNEAITWEEPRWLPRGLTWGHRRAILWDNAKVHKNDVWGNQEPKPSTFYDILLGLSSGSEQYSKKITNIYTKIIEILLDLFIANQPKHQLFISGHRTCRECLSPSATWRLCWRTVDGWKDMRQDGVIWRWDAIQKLNKLSLGKIPLLPISVLGRPLHFRTPTTERPWTRRGCLGHQLVP